MFKELLKKENPVIFEIGANDGTDTVNFFKEFKNPTLHCFEPDPDTFKRFLEKTKSFSKNIYSVCSALSDKEGEVEFYISSNICNSRTGLSSSMKKPLLHLRFHPEVFFTHKNIFKTTTLDKYAADNNIKFCDLVWMDVQGAEDLVIKGGQEFFKNTKYIYTEFSNVELYEGAMGKFEIERALPNFRIVKVIREWAADGDVLLINKNKE